MHTNNQIRTFLAIFLFSLSAVSLTGQNVDGGATEIMQKLAAKYRNYSTISIDYTFKSEKNGKVTDTQKGKMIMKGNKYFFTFSGQEYICDNVTVWNYQKATNEVSVYEYDESDDAILNPAKLLANWQKEFKAKFIREESQNNRFINIIDLTPIKSQSYYKIRFHIDKIKSEILRITIYEKDNTLYSYYFDKFITNTNLDDKLFSFDTTSHPGVEINDMR